ncbi:MAG TPA: succinate dehydrogenase, hydrophobic membrane anchor protein [Parvibaculum sp.]
MTAAAKASRPSKPVKSATRAFRRQRTTALALFPLALVFVAVVVALAGADYDTAKHYLGNPLLGAFFVLLILAGVIHMRIGMMEIIDDYVPNAALRHLTLFLNYVFAVAVGLTCLYAVVKIVIGF